MRKTKEELDKLMAKEKVDRIWSYSRISTFKTSPYEYLLKYIKHIPEDRQDCIYTSTGTLCHDILDKYYENEISYEKMIDEFEDGWLVNRDIAGLKFDRNDETKDINIGNKYYNNLVHFFKNHTVINHKVIIEPFVHTKINNNLFIGYIDCLFKDDDGCYNIIDFKTSSMYKGEDLKSHSGQLILYAIALNKKGIPLDKIKCGFNFLKYCEVEYQLKKGNVKIRYVERSKIGESLQSNVKTWLKAFDYDVDEYAKLLIDTNSIECLPKEVQDKYKIKDCYVYIPITSEIIYRYIEDLSITIQDILLREKDYAETQNDKVFWDSEESVKSESYYFATLCGYSPNLHLPYKAYLEKFEEAKNGANLFSGTETSVSSTDKYNCQNDTDIDLSWMDDI